MQLNFLRYIRTLILNWLSNVKFNTSYISCWKNLIKNAIDMKILRNSDISLFRIEKLTVDKPSLTSHYTYVQVSEG